MQNKNKDKKNVPQASLGNSAFSKGQLFALTGAIVLVTFLSFSPSMNNDFINQDDDIYVYNNPDLGKPIPEAIAYFFGPHYYSGNYIPVTMIAYTLAYHNAAAAPDFYHALSILFHLANILLVFWFVYLLSKKKILVAALVSLFFGIHPVHVESVAWASELKDVLYTFFFMAGLIAYYKYNELTSEKLIPEPGTNAQGRVLKQEYKLLFGCFILFIFSVLCKPAAIIFPVVLFLIDFYTRRKYDTIAWLEKVPFLIVSVIFGSIAIKAQYADDLFNNHYPFVQRLLFASYALTSYLAKFVVPIHLSTFYPYPIGADGHLTALVYVSPALIVLIGYGVYRSLKHSRVVAFGFLFFLINTVLMLQFVSVGNAVMADRYTYVSYIGLLFICAMGFDHFYNSTKEKLMRYKPVAIGVIVSLALGCSFLTYARCKVWENRDTISVDVLNNFPDDPIALNNRGYLLYREGNYTESIKLLRQAIALKPNFVKTDYVKAYINLADCYIGMKDLGTAQNVMEDALLYAPHDHYALNKMGCVLSIQHQYTAALKFFNDAIFYKKNDVMVYMNLSHCYYDLHDVANWIKSIDQGLKYAPNDYLLLNDKGYSLLLAGNYNLAITYFKASLENKPGFVTANANLQNCYRAINDSMKLRPKG